MSFKQITFALFSSPAVMGIRRLLALESDKVERGDARQDGVFKLAKMALLKIGRGRKN